MSSPPPPQTQPTEQKQDTSSKSSGMSVMAIVYSVISALIGIAYCYGAARLSYTKYGSILWAILAFIFAPIYYPFYALFLHTAPTAPLIGGRRMKW